MSEEKKNITIKYGDVGARSPVLEALNNVADNLFGGRQDQALAGLCKRVHDGVKDYGELSNKAFKQFGHLDAEMGPGSYSVKGLPMEQLKEMDTLLDEYRQLEIDLKITEPIKLKKRRSHKFTAMDAALVADFIEIEYDQDDDGKWLDEEKKK